MNLKKSAGLCALYAALAYSIGFIVLFTVFNPGQLNELDSLQRLLFYIDHLTFLHYWNIVIYVGFGIALIPLVIALDQTINSCYRDLEQVGKIFGFIWAALVITSGMVSNIGLTKVSSLVNESSDTAIAVWNNVSIIQDAFGGGVEIVGGLWVLIVSFTSYQSGSFAKWINIIGITIGLCGLLTVLPPLKDLGALFGLGQIIWFLAIGFNLLKSSRTQSAT